ncbi:MAG: nucleotidyltransferase domain-containing protein, partial [Anaerolineae bacterium]
DIVIQAENLGKKYTTGHQAENGHDVALPAQGRDLRDPARGIRAKLWYHKDKVKDQGKKGIKMNHDEVQRYIPAIVACLQPLDPAQVILFGSGARALPGEIGDLDLLVVTKADYVPRTYREKEEIYLTVAQALRAIRQRIPVDLIVHTRPMFARFIEQNSQFARRVVQEGRVLYESDHS